MLLRNRSRAVTKPGLMADHNTHNSSSTISQPNILVVLPSTPTSAWTVATSLLTEGSTSEDPSSSTTLITAAHINIGSPSVVVPTPEIPAPETAVCTSEPSAVLVKADNTQLDVYNS